jgi:ubiquinone/menaquinone biosynthesis C-methylase UbiE
MDNSKLKEEWINLSKNWIKESREGRNPSRNGLLDKPMLEECGDVTGLNILDCGCGEGRFCRILAKKNAKYVLGIDLCEPMINAAKELQGFNDEYMVADAQNLNFLKKDTFDIAISYLNQCDLPEYEKNNKEIYRVLKTNGYFIVANLHPMRSAVGNWHKNENGNKEHIILDKYFDESERHWKMLNFDFTNYHRTLSTYINNFIETGFTLTKIIEPTITKDQLIEYPELEDELRVPNFIIYKLKK